MLRPTRKLVADFVAAHSIASLVVDLESGVPHIDEVYVFYEDPFGFGRSGMVPGMRITKTFRFSGDGDLWNTPPSTFGMIPPRGTIDGQTITFGIELPSGQGDQAKAYLEQQLASSLQYIGWQTNNISDNARLPVTISMLVAGRRCRANQANDLLSKL